jgi:hypothetical protein
LTATERPEAAATEETDQLDPRWIGVSIPCEHWHFHRQLLDRYRIVLAPGEFSLMVSAIKTGEALLIERRGRKEAIYSVRIPSVHERIYVLAAGPNIVTAWPPGKRINDVRRARLAELRGRDEASD